MIAPAQKEPDLALAGLALIVIFGLLIWHDHPMRSDRPFDSSVMQPQYPHTTGYAYESWLWQDPFSFDSSEYIQKDQYYIEYGNYEEKTLWPKSLRLRKKLDLEGDNYSKTNSKNGTNDDGLCTDRFKEDLSEQQPENLEILLSLVNVRPNTVENKETRIRHRYAVIAGLMESGYYPSRPDRLNFCTSQNARANSDRQFDVRWEHFSSKSNEENIIVAWIDSNAFFEINSEEKNSKFINFVSNNFQSVDVHIFDWIDTITAGKPEQNIEIIQPAQINQELSKKLVEELKNRRITKSSEIAIITEQDSKAVRSLVRAFKESFNEGNKITTFSYFKGLDAYQQVIDKQEHNEDYQAARQWDIRLSATDLRNPPVGPAQYDYLHRIAREIRQTHDVIDLEKRMTGIKAVGIFGSDFYDKLLVLKALRAEMPSLLVFTTDLDAHMFHPQHWRWTRNLVVASPFDLQLNEQYQKLFPAFRDSQQTEIFYRTLCILEPTKCSSGNGQANENVPSLIFEIGRDGPVRLTLPGEGTTETTIHPANNSLEQSHFQITLLFVITLTLILIIANVRPHSGALVVWLLISSVTIFGLAQAALTNVAGEPLSFTNGTSLWPTIFIQTIAILLAIAFSVKGLFMLESNFYHLHRQYFDRNNKLETLGSNMPPRSITEILLNIRKIFIDILLKIKDIFSFKEKWCKKIKQLLDWPYCHSTILLTIISFLYAFNDWKPEGLISFWICLSLLGLLAIVYLCIEYRSAKIKSIKYWVEKDHFYPNKTENTLFTDLLLLVVMFCLLAILFYESINFIFLKQRDPYFLLIAIIVPIFFIILTSISLYPYCSNKESDYSPERKWETTDSFSKFTLLEDKDDYFNGLWKEYHEHGQPDQILLRVAVMWLFFAIIETILFYLLPPWPSPCRGASCNLNQLTGIVGFILTMLLTFFVLDAVRLNYYFIRKLRTKHPLLLDDTAVQNIEGSDQDVMKDLKKFYRERTDNPLETLEKIVTLVAERTLVADKLIYYPLLCIMLMLFARITYFDNQDFPLSKAITFGAAISLLIFSGFMIRYEAQKLKQAAVMSAENLVGNIDPDGHRCVRKLKEISDGIFQPMLEQPVMRALLLILASVGLFAGEYLMLANF